MGYIFQLLEGGGEEEDALIAKKKWHCLSCDKKLENYKGKVGQYSSPTHLFKSDAPKQEVMGGGMAMHSQSKFDLPLVRRNKKRN